MLPPPKPLPDELVEEVLLRFPPEGPAGLIRAGLVCTRWCRLVSAPGFRRRFREFHRCPPMLGMLSSMYDKVFTSRFIPTTAFCTPRTDFRDMRVLDACHGRVLFVKGRSVLAVWDPITNEVWELPFPEGRELRGWWSAAILCSTAGACDHLDCHHSPFQVVFVCTNNGKAVIYTYSSDAAAWSEPVIGQDDVFTPLESSVLVRNALYFRCYSLTSSRITALKYNFELCQLSMIQLPSSVTNLQRSPLTTMEDGGLGLINKDDNKLFLWSLLMLSGKDATWERRVTIDLNKIFPVDVDVTKLDVIGSSVGIIFMSTDDEVYTIDLKTSKVKKVYEGTAHTIVPYMSFYTPALKAARADEEPGAGCSSA